MSKLEMPIGDFVEIRTSADMQAAVDAETSRIAGEANSLAGTTDGYGTDLTVGTDRVRGHVWAKTGEALHAEAKDSPLMKLAGRGGAK